MILLHAQNTRLSIFFSILRRARRFPKDLFRGFIRSTIWFAEHTHTHSSQSHIKHNNTVCVKPKPWSKKWSDLRSSTVHTNTHHLAIHTDSFDSIFLYFACSRALACSFNSLDSQNFHHFFSFVLFILALWLRFVYFHTFKLCSSACVLFSQSV